jgi:hypothetical protein
VYLVHSNNITLIHKKWFLGGILLWKL